jgi:hypothetical protein
MCRLLPCHQVVSEEEREDLKVLARSYQIKFEAEVEKQGRIISAEVRLLGCCIYNIRKICVAFGRLPTMWL